MSSKGILVAQLRNKEGLKEGKEKRWCIWDAKEVLDSTALSADRVWGSLLLPGEKKEVGPSVVEPGGHKERINRNQGLSAMPTFQEKA